MIPSNRWAIVLAGGAGSRLSTLTTDARGAVIPKQFCTLSGEESLLDSSLARAERLVPRERVVVIVTAQHEAWWRNQLEHLPRQNVVVQPKNRGTAAGLVLPLLTTLARDPDPSIVVVPSDHYVDDEAALAGSMEQACEGVERGAAGVVMLGIAPDSPASDYGWITPGRDAGRLKPVETFVEKPDRPTAARLMARGALWNSFLMAARGRTILALIDRCLPGLPRAMREALWFGGDSLAGFYETLASADLSRDVLQRRPGELRVLEAPPCGWTDLGTPQRVAGCLTTFFSAPRRTSAGRPSSSSRPTRINLRQELQRLAVLPADARTLPSAAGLGPEWSPATGHARASIGRHLAQPTAPSGSGHQEDESEGRSVPAIALDPDVGAERAGRGPARRQAEAGVDRLTALPQRRGTERLDRIRSTLVPAIQEATRVAGGLGQAPG